jgi:sugar phosphate isomerase/epimerase
MSLDAAAIGYVPIVWNNADLFDLAPETAGTTVMDEIARLGYGGLQFGRGFPEGDELRRALAARSLRFAELYSAIDAGPDGLAPDAAATAHRDLG